MRLALHVHYRPFSVTSEERASEPPLNGYPSTKGHGLYEVRVCETCACVIHISTHIVSISIVILH